MTQKQPDIYYNDEVLAEKCRQIDELFRKEFGRGYWAVMMFDGETVSKENR